MSKYIFLMVFLTVFSVMAIDQKEPPSLRIGINGVAQGGTLTLNWTSQPDKGAVTVQTTSGQTSSAVATLLSNALNAKTDFYKAGSAPFAKSEGNLVIVAASSPGDFFMTSTDLGIVAPPKITNVVFETLENPLRIRISWDAPSAGVADSISIQCGWSLLTKLAVSQTSYEHIIQSSKPTLLVYSIVLHKDSTPGDKFVQTITNPKE